MLTSASRSVDERRLNFAIREFTGPRIPSKIHVATKKL